MIEVRQTEAFERWIRSLRDGTAKIRITARLQRLEAGNPGDVRPVGQGVSELRIDHGPGYRVYYIQRGQSLVIVLGGGDKASQERDIKAAIELARGV